MYKKSKLTKRSIYQQ